MEDQTKADIPEEAEECAAMGKSVLMYDGGISANRASKGPIYACLSSRSCRLVLVKSHDPDGSRKTHTGNMLPSSEPWALNCAA